jgi:arginase
VSARSVTWCKLGVRIFGVREGCSNGQANRSLLIALSRPGELSISALVSVSEHSGGRMDICLVEVPYHAGDDRHPSSRGPRHLLDAGALDLLATRHEVTVRTVIRPEPFYDTASSSSAVNKLTAALVREAVSAGQFPLVLAGSCTTSHGVLAALEHARTGIVWIDAHADFNTPETTTSGYFPGMSLAVLTGHCYHDYFAQIGDSTPVAEGAIALFGVRDLSPAAERERLERSEVQVVEWWAGKPKAPVVAALDRVASRVPDVYLHIDLDGFAPEVAPGVADRPVPGGLSIEDAEMILRATSRRFKIKAATLATYTPDRDRGDRTLRTALRLIETIGRSVAESQ